MERKAVYWLRLLGALCLVAALAACGGSASPADEVPPGPQAGIAQQGEGASGSSTTVNVVAKDMKYALDPSQASAGTITFVVTNDDPMPHDFAIEVNGVEHKTALIEAGNTESITVDLEPGTYKYWCTVTGHSLAGMRGTFTITGS